MGFHLNFTHSVMYLRYFFWYILWKFGSHTVFLYIVYANYQIFNEIAQKTYCSQFCLLSSKAKTVYILHIPQFVSSDWIIIVILLGQTQSSLSLLLQPAVIHYNSVKIILQDPWAKSYLVVLQNARVTKVAKSSNSVGGTVGGFDGAILLWGNCLQIHNHVYIWHNILENFVVLISERCEILNTIL